MTTTIEEVPFREAVRVWARIGLESFGGPAAQIAVMHRVVVEERRWLTEQQFLHALNYCILLPGPEAQQLAIYCGWLLHGYRGGLVAGWLFVLPGALVMLALSIVYASYQDVTVVAGMFFGLRAAVLAIVFEAVVRICRRVIGKPSSMWIAAAAFVGIFFFTLPFPVIVLGAALAGFTTGRGGSADASAATDAPLAKRGALGVGRALRVAGLWGGLWLAPVVAITYALGPDSVWSELARFFSLAAVLTFGGAYAVLAFVGQRAVEVYGWLEPGEMLVGLGMAETTPGPLILVLEFVGFLGAHREPGALPPVLAGTLGAGLVLWVTFAPCFLWIFLGAPYAERLRGMRALDSALGGVTAAVVGVILNLSVWLTLHTLFSTVEDERAFGVRLLLPDLATLNIAALAIGAGATIAVFRWHVGTLKVLGAAVTAGIALRLLGFAALA
ncbi:MAG: chromate efflux transporter [Dehalococcoidia bacterium]|nr:chromate efflux transporter [Dehalococcoidia bacterium]